MSFFICACVKVHILIGTVVSFSSFLLCIDVLFFLTRAVVNGLTKFVQGQIDHVICVSHTRYAYFIIRTVSFFHLLCMRFYLVQKNKTTNGIALFFLNIFTLWEYCYNMLNLFFFFFLHCSKENQVLRCQLDARKVSVVPNAVDTSSFSPCPSRRDDSRSKCNICIKIPHNTTRSTHSSFSPCPSRRDDSRSKWNICIKIPHNTTRSTHSSFSPLSFQQHV